MQTEVANDSKNVKCNLIKLRNPTGKGKYNGDWGTSLSKRWTPDMKLRFNVFDEDEDNGIFWMQYEDFIKFFSEITICFYEDGYEYSF